ncbi:DNA polymerase IV [Corynebacterium glaucum]|uniref:DNA polymerase IV n=1 Tax=Corynebacterium glaucum TaxID=187491 RepID=A0A1Q2HUD4_9CORY|nr:DNA polymerase Y family protein [Corynebacterium glaucum]AQQ14458.1 DNA polymerase IV [Corynebacterium glaucum]
MRVAAVWFPDWPVQAAKLELGDAVADPIVIGSQHRVKVCSHAARQLGIRRGMKLRNAQAIAPELTVVDDNADRDGRMFASLAASFDDVAASVEVLRPGLVIVDLAAAARFHGSEDTALEMLVDASARRGIDAFAGAADEIATAALAARTSRVVAPGQSAAFLATHPLTALTAETALGADAETVNVLGQLGVATLGDIAAIPPSAMTTRFGAHGMHIHRIASAAPDRRVAPELPTADLAVAITPEDPIERVDAAAFAARALAASLHERLKATGRNCLRLKITAELDGGERVERVWRTREALTESGTADRVRWQLDGWLTSGGAGAITSLVLEPLELAEPVAVGELWSQGASTDGARRVIERVQSQLGIDAVVQPRLVGGRGVAERVRLVAFGEAPPSTASALTPARARASTASTASTASAASTRPHTRASASAPVKARPETKVQALAWPGAIPGPLPARLGGGIDHPASSITLIDASANPITVTAEALLSSDPYALAWGEKRYLVTGWAGPWPVDEGWWGSDTNLSKVARLQVVGCLGGEDGEPTAWLLVWTRRRWRVEAVY